MKLPAVESGSYKFLKLMSDPVTIDSVQYARCLFRVQFEKPCVSRTPSPIVVEKKGKIVGYLGGELVESVEVEAAGTKRAGGFWEPVGCRNPFNQIDKDALRILLEKRKREAVARRRKNRASSAKGGRTEKRRTVILEAICAYLKDNTGASNDEVWQSFPESYDEAATVGGNIAHSVFRNGRNLYQCVDDGVGRKLIYIKRTTFDDVYMPLARKKVRESSEQS